jgi:dihydrofolate reductase
MRKLILAMMTTLNGRLDDPEAWLTGIDDEQYAEIDRYHEEFDTIVMGSTVYREMVAYWPGALNQEEGFAGSSAAVNQSMARKMNSYKKYVLTKHADPQPLEWNNAEAVHVGDDRDLVAFVDKLKKQSGRHIHIAGGAATAQSFLRLGLVDEIWFFVYPVVSAGARWFDTVETPPNLELVSATPYENGVVGLYYRVGSTPS